MLAAFGEELAFRGTLGRDTHGVWFMSLGATSILFGWAHGGQGITGMIQEGFAGLLLGLLYLGCGRNLTVPVVAHGVANMMAFVLIYFDRYPGM